MEIKMAVMTTVLTQFDITSGTFTAPSHTVTKPSLVIQKRKVAVGVAGIAETSIKTVQGTVDVDSNPLASKYTFETISRGPVNGTAADLAAALALHREIVASDEFTNPVDTQEYIA